MYAKKKNNQWTDIWKTFTFINYQRYAKQNHNETCQPVRMDITKRLNITNMDKMQRKDKTCTLQVEMWANRGTKEIMMFS